MEERSFEKSYTHTHTSNYSVVTYFNVMLLFSKRLLYLKKQQLLPNPFSHDQSNATNLSDI